MLLLYAIQIQEKKAREKKKVLCVWICFWNEFCIINVWGFLLFSRNEINSQWNCFYSERQMKKLYKLEMQSEEKNKCKKLFQ